MINQIPSNEIGNYVHLFKENKFLGKVLRGYMSHSLCDCYVDADLTEIGVCSLFDGKVWFLGGNKNSKSLDSILEKIPYQNLIFVPNIEWAPLLAKYWSKIAYHTRIQFSSKDLSIASIQKLLKPLPDGFSLEQIDLETSKKIQSPNYPGDIEKRQLFVKEGIGFCIKDNSLDADKNVIGYVTAVKAFDYEIDVNVSSNYRKKGFATILSAKLIEHCLQHNIVPHWDADNEISAMLAIKLGFVDPIEYNTYIPLESWPESMSEESKTFHGLVIAKDVLKGIQHQLSDENILKSIEIAIDKINYYIVENNKEKKTKEH